MANIDPLYLELKRYPETDATVFLLSAVAAQETGDLVTASQRLEEVNTVQGQLNSGEPQPLIVFAEAYDRALGILAATGRTRWVEIYGAYAESVGNAVIAVLEANSQLDPSHRRHLEEMAPVSGIARREGREYVIFDGANRRTDAQLRQVIQGESHVEGRHDHEVVEMASRLPTHHPVARMLMKPGATAGNDKWTKPYLFLREGNDRAAADALKQAFGDLLNGAQHIMATSGHVDEQMRVDFIADLMSVEEVAAALFEAERTSSGRDREAARQALTQIGAVVATTTQTLPRLVSSNATTIWNDGSITFDGERIRIPGADLTPVDISNATQWLTGEVEETPSLFRYESGGPDERFKI